MYKNENQTESQLDFLFFNLFKEKIKQDKTFRKKIILYQNIDNIMRGVVLAEAAEKEMKEKNIDVITAGFVDEFFRNN